MGVCGCVDDYDYDYDYEKDYEKDTHRLTDSYTQVMRSGGKGSMGVCEYVST